MSKEAYTLAGKVIFPKKPAKKLVLMYLAGLYNDEVGYAWPSYKAIAEYACVTRRAAINLAEELQRDGFVRITPRCGNGARPTSNAFELDMAVLRAHVTPNDSEHSSLTIVNTVHHKGDENGADSEHSSPYGEHSSLTIVNTVHPHSEHSSPYILSYSNSDISREGEPARADGQPQPAAVTPPPPVVVRSVIPDRSPGGMGYELSDEPPADRTPRHKPAPSPEVAAIGEMANALTDVTGVSSRLNWGKVAPVAGSLVEDGYTPEQVRRHFGRVDPGPGAWWYWRDDWRGKTTEKRKGEPPTLAVILERIGLAVHQPGVTAPPPVKPQKKPSQIDLLLASLNPKTAGAA
jgi:hypothetical protein